MDTLLGISAGHIGILVWVIWLAIGVFEALLATRICEGRNLMADIVTGGIAGLLGGYFSVNFVGDAPLQRFLISVLGAIFLAAVALWILGRFLRRR